jgi:hypothetical protein
VIFYVLKVVHNVIKQLSLETYIFLWLRRWASKLSSKLLRRKVSPAGQDASRRRRHPSSCRTHRRRVDVLVDRYRIPYLLLLNVFNLAP